MLDAFRAADQVLLSGVQGITDLITTPGLINLDFADVKSVMQGAGSALMGIGSARGDDRAVQAAEMAISSPLLEATIDGAHGVLLSIQGGSDLGLFEINEAARLVEEAAHPEANIIFGAVIDDALGDEVRVTVIAAGLRRRRADAPRRRPRARSGPGPVAPPAARRPRLRRAPRRHAAPAGRRLAAGRAAAAAARRDRAAAAAVTGTPRPSASRPARSSPRRRAGHLRRGRRPRRARLPQVAARSRGDGRAGRPARPS